jgi:hypothetical protein
MHDDQNEDQNLIDLLTRLAGDARRHFDHYPRLSTGSSPAERAEHLVAQSRLQEFEELRRAVQDEVQKHQFLGASESRFFGAKQLMVHPHYAAYHLLKEAVARRPSEAVAWLRKVYATCKADLRYVVEIHGLKLDNQIAVSNGVRLMPLAQLPPSPHAAALVAHYAAFPAVPTARPMFPPIVGTFEIFGVQRSGDYEAASR